MKVAMHVDQLSAAVPGGIGTYIRELVPALADLPDTGLVLFHSKGAGQGIPRAWRDSFEVVALQGSSRTLYPRWNVTGHPELPSALRSADVIHAPLPAAIPPHAPDQRLVVTIHDLAFEAFPETFPMKWRWLYRRGLRAASARADAIITPSHATADDLANRAPHPNVTVIPEAASLPHSPDTDPIEVITRLRITAPFILAVGTVEPRKNLVSLIRAYRHILAHNDLSTSLVIAGPDGWHAEEIHRAARGGPGRITFTGRLPAAELDAVYRAAWCATYLSSYEGFGLPVLDAMVRGIPMVASSASSIPEVAGDAAVLVEPTDVRGIADALERILVSENAAAALSTAGRERAASFSWARAAAATREVYAG